MAGPPGHPLIRAVLVHALETSADVLNKKGGLHDVLQAVLANLAD